MPRPANPQQLPPPFHLSVVTTTDPVTGQLSRLLAALQVFAEYRQYRIEAVIVDDLKLWSEAPALPASPCLRCVPIRYAGQRGQLQAALTGIRQASAPLVLTLDPDMHTCVDDLPDMLETLAQGHALVHGVRTHRSGLSPLRRFGSRCINVIMRHLGRLPIDDIQSPVALFYRDFFDQHAPAASQCRNPRLAYYALAGSALASHSLKGSATAEGVSQYRFGMLLRLFLDLLGDAIVIRRFTRQPHGYHSDTQIRHEQNNNRSALPPPHARQP
jgi:hypothetical protein